MTASGKRYNIKRMLFISMILFLEAVIIYLLIILINYILTERIKQVENDTKIDKMIVEDMKYFPIPLKYQSEVTFDDTFGAYRNNGGHEGCDIMDVSNSEGRIPVISSTDGVITNIGWLYLGGYRIGITADSGIYYYYAHMSSYASGLKAGDMITAGQLIGFMGSTGEGNEGTSGRFPVHLHFGIYTAIKDGNEKAVNSYPYLKRIYLN